jgi:F0F1-type ATP synthase assembly protein I
VVGLSRRQTGIKGVRKMKLDEHLITGIFLGVVVGLFYTAQLVPYTALFLIGTIVLILRYVHK